jgi:hypothetical protein
MSASPAPTIEYLSSIDAIEPVWGTEQPPYTVTRCVAAEPLPLRSLIGLYGRPYMPLEDSPAFGQMEPQMPRRERGHTEATSEDLLAVEGVSEAIDRSVISPQSMLPAYLQLAILLRGLIIARQLPTGTVLPSEPELQQRYKISRDTVRKGMQLLREIGLAEMQRGIGHFVSRTPEIRRVVLAPGSRVIVRMPQPPEQVELLALVVYVVTEPGKPPVVYDTAQTVLVVQER